MDSTSPNAVVVSRPDYDGTLTQAAREDYTFFTHLSTLLPTNLSTPCHSSPSTPARRPPAHLEAHPAPYSTEYLSSSIPVISTWLPSPASLGRNFCPSQPYTAPSSRRSQVSARSVFLACFAHSLLFLLSTLIVPHCMLFFLSPEIPQPRSQPLTTLYSHFYPKISP